MAAARNNEAQIVKTLISICQSLHARNLLAAADGNVSYRISDRRILITPAGRHKAFLTAKDFAVINLQGDIVRGHPSSERLMHLEVFRRCPLARCVVHAHPPTAIAWSVARPDLKELPSTCLSEVILAVGAIPIAAYARPSTAAMGEVLAPHLPHSRVLIMARHGALSWGESADEAYNGMERLEHAAQILKSAHELGGLTALPAAEVAALKAMRAKIGERSL